jgi:antirestriction protein ArdC
LGVWSSICQDKSPNSEAHFLYAELRITSEPRADHAQYLASWLAVLKADKKAIFNGARRRVCSRG